MNEGGRNYLWVCPHVRCEFTFRTASPESILYCPDHSNRLVPEPKPPVTKPVGDMIAFLATDRAMGTLSAVQRIMDAPHARDLWGNEALQKLIAGEWKALKELMKEAGFE